MRSLLKILPGISLLLLAVMVMQRADAETTPSRQLDQILQQSSSITANFQQKNYDVNGKPIQSASGTMAMQRPDKFRWYVKAPTEQLIIANGTKVWIYDIDLEQAALKRMDKEGDTSPAMLLRGSLQEIERSYTISSIQKKKELGYRLTAKNKDNLFQTIDLFFNVNMIRNMDITDNLGNTTRIVFSHVIINPVLKSSVFTLTLPKTVDVIR